ncbi:MAG: hypothetical protein IIC33_03955 [Chloroflexi bacterium]|nr:hypothetical protein [Chloroflexota bacterium]
MSQIPTQYIDVSLVTRLRLNAWAGINPVLLTGSLDWLAYGGITLLHLLTGLLFIFNTASGQSDGFHSLPLDEAWTRMVYARNFAEHFAFQYNPGTAEAGFTSPLWVILLGGIYKVTAFTGVTLPAIAKLLGIGFGIGASIVALKLVQTITGSKGLALMAAAVIALEPFFTFSKVSGTESALFAFAALAAAAAYYRNRLAWTGVLLALAVAARPEGLLLLVLTGIALGLKILWERGDLRLVPGKDLLIAIKVAGPSALVILLSTAMNMTANGTPYPNSYLVAHVPTGLLDLPNLWSLLGGYLASTSFFASSGIAASSVLLVLAWIRYIRHRRFNGLPLLAFPLVLIYSMSVNLPFEASGWTITDRRYLDPVLPFLVVGLSVGIFYARGLLGSLGLSMRTGESTSLLKWKGAGWAIIRPGSTGAKWIGLILTLFFGLLVILPYAQIPRDFVALSQQYSWNNRNLQEVNVAAAHWVAQNLPKEAVLGVLEGGAIRFFGNQSVIDLSGINTHTAIGKPVFQAAQEHNIDYLVAFRNIYFDSWPRGDEVAAFSTEQNTILPGAELVVYQVSWDRVVTLADKTIPHTLDVSGLVLIDFLDVGNQAQEEAHFYALDQPSTLVERVFHIAKEQGQGIDIKDDARTSTGSEEFVVKSQPGRPLILAKRYDAAVGGSVAVYVEDKFVGDWDLAPRDFVFGEDTFHIGPEVITGTTTKLRFEYLMRPGTNLNSFYYWIYTSR